MVRTPFQTLLLRANKALSCFQLTQIRTLSFPMSSELDYTVNPVHVAGTDSDFNVMDTMFIEQIASTREALKIFRVVTALDEPRSSKAVLEELVNNSVRDH